MGPDASLSGGGIWKVNFERLIADYVIIAMQIEKELYNECDNCKNMKSIGYVRNNSFTFSVPGVPHLQIPIQ